MSYLGIEPTPEEAARQLPAENKANTIFILSLVSILFCCLGGIIASVIANQAKSEAGAGNLESAERKTNIALGLMIASFVIGGLSVLGQISKIR